MKKDVLDRLIWLDGQILNVNDAKINMLSPTAQFGLNVFEGIRCYWNEKESQLYAFRLDDHFKRLKRSQLLLQIADKYTIDELKEAFFDAVKANEYKEDISVRQTIFIDGFGSWSSEESVNMFVAPIPKTKTSAEYNKKGLQCCISSWQRINENSISPRIKCGANYINSRMAQREALRNGYDTAIFLNNAGKISEGPGSCLFMIRDGVLITPQHTDSVLESITRDTIIKLAAEMNIEVTERSIDRTELYLANEAFLCGSAMEVTPIFSIDRYILSQGSEGNYTFELRKKYLECVHGESKNHFDWVTPVYE